MADLPPWLAPVRELPPWLAVVGALFVLFVAAVVATSLHRPTPPTFVPARRAPAEVGAGTVMDDTVTVDAREPERWVFFDFSRGAAVAEPGPEEWDLAFRRYRIVVNGGAGYAGRGGVRDLGAVAFEAAARLPAGGYAVTDAPLAEEPEHPVLADWYRYDFFAHLLSPRPRTYAVRTADGRFAKIRFLGYYCPGPDAGCVTFRYAYRGDGGRSFEAPPARRRGDAPPDTTTTEGRTNR